ncbi:MAG: urea transporter [Candidatus Diapherotrites archaeon]
MRLKDSAGTILRGISQVMLQENAATGLLFLIGIFLNSWLLCIGALLGTVVGTATALLLKYNREEIRKGLYGFNAALVGIAMLYVFRLDLILAVLTIAGAALSTVVMNFMHTRRLRPYTFPFVISTWLLMAPIFYFGLAQGIPQQLPPSAGIDIISSLAMGTGQVMFQASIITGIIFLIAIFINSRRAAIYAFAGSLAGMLAAVLLAFPLGTVNAGIFGFNAVLCGIAFSGYGKNSAIYALFSAVLSVFIIYSINLSGWPALTAPFVFATWITLMLTGAAGKRANTRVSPQ